MTSVKVATREAYQFAAEPKIVNSRAKYRPTNENRTSENELTRSDRAKKNTINIDKSPSKKSSQNPTQRAETTEPEEIVPENVYAELTERENGDAVKFVPYYYIDKPKTPQFKPVEAGVDVATQIEDSELFDFKLEVEPVLSVLIGKTLEQARLELCEEEERTEEKRHRMTFERTRNAELMVTQRKEALHTRKQDEKARREKQHQIQTENKTVIHQRYIARLLAKNTTFGMGGSSINILADQGVLSINLRTEMRKDLVPYLIQTTMAFLQQHDATRNFIKTTAASLQNQFATEHAKAVKSEFDRRQKIVDDKNAEEKRLAEERKHRRERRRLLRQFCNKESLLDKISSAVVSRAQEITNALDAEVVDMFSTNKEAVATIGGLIGEIWLVLEALCAEKSIELSMEQLINIFVHLLTKQYSTRDFNIYVNEQFQPLIKAFQDEMADDLVSFNKNKTAKIEELANQLDNFNGFQNLGTLNSHSLLDKSLFKQINKALLHIYFASVDYKPPVKKQKSLPAEQSAAPQNQADVQNTEGSEQKEGEEPKPVVIPQSEIVEIPQEEEFVMPAITPFEEAMVQAKKHLKLNYINDWTFAKDLEAIVRFRIPLNRVVENSNPVEENNEDVPQVEVVQEPVVQKKDENSMPNLVGIPQEERDQIFRQLVLNNDFIEPFNGTSFEREKTGLTEQISGPTLKIYNTKLVEGRLIAQINERSQERLRKELITLVKEHVEEWKEVQDESILAKSYIKYKNIEGKIFSSLINNPESVAVFDIESN